MSEALEVDFEEVDDAIATISQSYGADFEKHVILLLLNDSTFAAAALPLLKPDYFEDASHSLVVEHAQLIHKTTSKIPSIVSVKASVFDAMTRAKDGPAKSTIQRAHQLCEIDTAVNPADRDFIRSRVSEFVQKSATRVALLRAIELHDKGKNDEAVQLIIKSRDDISTLLTNTQDDGLRHFDTVKKIRSYLARNSVSHNCPYGIPKLDALMRGGLERECLGIWMGPPGRGKTRSLVQGGATALGFGNVVVHITLELSKEDVGMRYDARLTGIPINDIKAHPKMYAKRIHAQTEALRAAGGELFIKQWAAGEATLLDVTSYLHRVQDMIGRPVDTLLLDYVDLLRPTRGEERWEKHGLLAVGLKRLAVTEKVRVWSASQTSKDSFSKRNIQLSDGADTVEKARISDVIIGLCQTEAEKRSGRMRLIILKNRLGGNEGKMIDCIVRDDTQSVQEDFTHTEARDAQEEEY